MRKCILRLALIVLCVASLLAETEDSVMVFRNGHTSYRGVKVRLGMDINDMVDEMAANDIIMSGTYSQYIYDPYGNFRGGGYIVKKGQGRWTMEPASENVTFIADMDKRLESISLYIPKREYDKNEYEVLYSAMDVDGLLISSDLSYKDLISLLKSKGIEYQILKRTANSTRVIFQTDKGYPCLIEYDNLKMTKDDKFYNKLRLIKIFVDK